jgi:mono/diheme cytochrome c family protein
MYSCVSNVEEILYPIDTCDTTSVTYSQTIAPIIAQNCFACHGGAATISGIPLEGFTNLKLKVTQGRLLGAIRRLQGFSPMPQNAPSLPECDILKIEKWIADGALDN